MKGYKNLFVFSVFFIALFLSATLAYAQTITASAGTGGSISPSGAVPVPPGTDQTFIITPAPDYDVLDVIVDSSSVGPTFSYTFPNVVSDHTIIATFTCANPVKLENWDGTFWGYDDKIMEAYDYAVLSGLTDFTLKLQDGIFFAFTENLIFDADVSVFLDGGYDCSFVDNSMVTKVDGSMTIAAGTVITSNIALAGTGPPPCVEGDPNNYPGNPEICDGLDNNCDGIADDGLGTDADGDGHYTPGSCALTYSPNDDCNDSDPDNFPGNPEICDGQDNNCDGTPDEGLTATDADGDGYTSIGSCGGSADDCNDSNPNINPGAIDYLGDGIDQDCNGQDLIFGPGSYNEANCLGCHGGAFTINRVFHKSVAAPDGSCVSCHDAAQINPWINPTDPVQNGTLVLPRHHGETVQTPDNNMLPGQKIRCTSCHDYHPSGTGYTINGANEIWPRVTAKWVGPPTNAYVNLTCDTCHLDRAAAHDTESGHDNRVIDPLCANCHTSDTSVLGQPGTGALATQSDVDTLHQSDCSFCHNYTGTAPDPVLVSDAIQNGIGGLPIDCLECHEVEFPAVHAFIENHNNLINVGITTCGGNCHSDPPPLVDAADPKVHNACSSCHNPDYTTKSLAEGKSLDPPGGDCTTCHGVDYFNQHSHDHTATVTGSVECVGCHEHNDPQIIAGIHSNACATCHFSSTPEVVAAIASGQAECIDCHSVHDGPSVHNNLGAPASCAICHTDKISGTDFNYIINNHGPHPTLGFNELDRCQRCHNSVVPEVVATISAGQGATGIPVDCSNCHVSQHITIADPVEIHDYILTNTGSTCSDCHIENNWTHTDMNATASCATCHDSANQDEFNALHQNDCLVCHLSPRSEVITKINDGIAGTPVECIDCHAAYGTDFFTGHQDPDHSDLVTTSTTYCAGCHTDTLVDDLDPKAHDSCLTCHEADGVLKTLAIGKSAPGNCTTCHGIGFITIHPDDVDHSQAIQLSTDCAGCHDGPPPVIDAGDPTNHGSCGICHDSEGSLINSASGNTAPNECITCHGNDLGTLHPTSGASHSATPGSDYVLVFAAGTHDSAMIGDGEVYIACNTCHSTELGAVHANSCSTCHPSPADTVVGIWTGGCQQGGCHTTRHENKTTAHFPVADQCTQCHGPGGNVFPPPPSSCANCHAVFNPADTLPPVTTSDAQPTYIIPALISFSITDGGKIGIGTTYFILDGGAEQRGSSVLVTSNGSHSLEFWSVDQAGNEETPHKFASFTITADTIPPVTTSNALSTYYNPATITLTATDNNPVGVTTYYSLNSGPTQSGTSVFVPELDGTFSYTLEFWSVDWSGNEELPHNTVNFTIIGGTGTLRLVLGNSDTSGSPCPGDPGAKANWTIRRSNQGGTVVATGAGSCNNSTDPGNWSGVNNVVVDVITPTPYFVSIDWWDSFEEFYENTTFTNVNITAHGDIVTLRY